MSLFGLRKIVPFLKRYKAMMAVMIGGSLAGSVVDIVIPLLRRYALNHYVMEETLDTLALFIPGYLFLILFGAFLNYFSCERCMRIEVQIDRDLRNAAFTHLQKMSFSYFNQNSVGYLHARVMSDTSRIGTLVSWGLMEGIWQIAYLVGALAVMFAINPGLAALVALVVPLVTVLFSLFQKHLVRVNREIRELNSKITGDFNEGITGAKTVKTLVIEKTMEKAFCADTDAMRKKSVRASRLRGAFSGTMHFASSLALAIVLWRGGYIAQSEIGTFSLFVSFAQGIMEPVRWIVDVISDLITTQVNIERLFKLIESRPDVTDSDEVILKYGDSFAPKTENWEEIRGDIDFEDVSFRYPDGDDYILEHFDLHIPFGTNLAIVGETGAGKSTLVNLVCRFYEPTQGRVLIDGRDARERSQLWLHSAIGYVLQTPHLFSGTVRENLLYGNPEATETQIWQALELVSAAETVQKLEKGLDTDVGEGGDLLSTGEKQLLSFARAILSHPKILVLDEATASVDTVTEQKIQSAIESVIKGRTSIVIAHRLSTVRNADMILAVRDGKLVERGSHEELMAVQGVYCRLYNRQYQEEATGRAFD